MSTPDFSYTAAFLECLAPGETQFTFQTFHDQVKGQPGRILHGTLEQHGPALLSAQAEGHGVFWTVNRTNLQGRADTDVTTVRCVWLDMDDPAVPIAPVVSALQPHCVVESSPGKHHLYWRVDDLPVHEAQAVLRALRIRWQGDKGATGVNRVFRIPGFQHLKTATPHLTRITAWQPQLPAYQRAHILHYLLDGQTPESFTDTAEQPLDTHLHEGPVDGWRNRISDEELQGRLNGQIQSAPTAAQAFGNSWTLHELWAPDMHALEAAKLRTEARLSLYTRLMYLTGGDSKRVHDLCENHPLGPKDGRTKLYLDELAIARRSFMSWWEPELARRQAQQAETKAMAEGAGPGVTITPHLMDLDTMCGDLIYVARGKGVVVRSTKQCFKLEDAQVYFAASKHEVVGEDGKVKKSSNLSAWIAHPEQRKTVGLMTWRPSEPEVCEPMEMLDGHQVAYNTWRGLKPYALPADHVAWAAWFTHHLEYLIPVDVERRRFLQWISHAIQKPGELPHTAYLMVTKTTGTGRNWLASVLARVFTGYCALGVPLGPILDGKFNGLLSQKLLAVVNEVREGMDGDKYARGEAMKNLINEERRNIDHKYGQQVVEQNCCRWLVFSNHEDDALPFDNTDRRIEVIQNPDYRKDEDYYRTLYSLLSQPAFIASVRHLLETTSLEGFNPGAPAQMNDAKRNMLDSMAGAVERAVSGFMQTWPERAATLSDLQAHVTVVTGEKARMGSLKHAMRRCGMVKHSAAIDVDGLLEVPITWGDPVADVEASIRAARARNAFRRVK